MAYRQGQSPADLDTEGLRKYTQEQLLRIQRAAATAEQTVTDLQTLVATHTAAIAKLTNKPLARVARITTDQAVAASAVAEKVQFNSVIFDPSSIWDAVNFRFKPTIAGYYRVNWVVTTSWSGSGLGANFMYVTGVRNTYGGIVPGNTSPPFIAGGSALVHLNGTTEYVEVWGQVNGTTGRVFGAGVDSTNMSIMLEKAD